MPSAPANTKQGAPTIWAFSAVHRANSWVRQALISFRLTIGTAILVTGYASRSNAKALPIHAGAVQVWLSTTRPVLAGNCRYDSQGCPSSGGNRRWRGNSRQTLGYWNDKRIFHQKQAPPRRDCSPDKAAQNSRHLRYACMRDFPDWVFICNRRHIWRPTSIICHSHFCCFRSSCFYFFILA